MNQLRAYEPECPNNAIYEGGVEWRYADGTSMTGLVIGKNNRLETDADESQEPISDECYYIVTDKCTEFLGFGDEPQCLSVCPEDNSVDDPDWRETKEKLIAKKEQMQLY